MSAAATLGRITTFDDGGGFLSWSQETGLIWIGMIGAALVALHLLASWAERRGWIHYRKPGGGGGRALSNALAEFEAVVNPAAEHRIEEEFSRRAGAEQPGTGEPEGHPTDDGDGPPHPRIDLDAIDDPGPGT